MKDKKVKIWHILVLIVAVILIIFMGILGRKIFIINKIKNKAESYRYCDNFYMKHLWYQGDYMTIYDTYHKGKNTLARSESINGDDVSIMTTVISNGSMKNYFERNDEKIAALKPDGGLAISVIADDFYFEKKTDIIKVAMNAKISSEKVNGKDCYKIIGLVAPGSLNSGYGTNVKYYDKETGLLVRHLAGYEIYDGINNFSPVNDYYYEFGTVTDEDIVEPDISGYTIVDTY